MKRIAIVAVAAAFSAAVFPAKADSIDKHNELLRAVAQTGTTIKINPRECDTMNAYGWYSAAEKELVVCQQNRMKGSSKQVTWTPEDFDTVRHESHHVVQDCRDGQMNGQLHAVYDEPKVLAKHILGNNIIAQILKAYSDSGAHIQTMELEAFAVAAMSDPEEQVRDVLNYCTS